MLISGPYLSFIGTLMELNLSTYIIFLIDIAMHLKPKYAELRQLIKGKFNVSLKNVSEKKPGE